MQVSQLMNDHVVSVLPSDTISCAARLLKQHAVGSLPVCDENGSLCGILTDRDITVRGVSCDIDTTKCDVRKIMTSDVVTLSPDADIKQAARLMSDQKIRRLPVVKDNKVVGMFSLGDIAMSHCYTMEVGAALSDISEFDN